VRGHVEDIDIDRRRRVASAEPHS